MEVPFDEEPPKPIDAEVVAEREPRRPRKSKEDKGSRKKDERTLEHVLKALNGCTSPTDKFDGLCKKYNELLEETKRVQLAGKVADKKIVVLQREKDQLQGEQTKSVLTRNRLEALCRELQRQNKLMKEESIQRIREEEERRKEVSAKFHATLAEITALMQQNTESNSKLRDENLEMQNQFKGVCQQYELREQQVEKISKQMKLEGQLADAKLAKARLELQAQKEILERDKAELMAEVARCQARCIDHEKTEEGLRQQINVYFAKYDEFQDVLTKSNKVYSGFKTEMEKMSKKITRLEKETSSWKSKWETSHKALLAVAAEKQLKDNEVSLQARQLAQLQKLCRTIQTERTALLQQLGQEDNGIKLKGESPAKDLIASLAKTEVDDTQLESQPAQTENGEGASEPATGQVESAPEPAAQLVGDIKASGDSIEAEMKAVAEAIKSVSALKPVEANPKQSQPETPPVSAPAGSADVVPPAESSAPVVSNKPENVPQEASLKQQDAPLEPSIKTSPESTTPAKQTGMKPNETSPAVLPHDNAAAASALEDAVSPRLTEGASNGVKDEQVPLASEVDAAAVPGQKKGAAPGKAGAPNGQPAAVSEQKKGKEGGRRRKK